jgi:hypothetical protein
MNATDFYLSETSRREMAAGVLKQAERDLRRFYGGGIGVERELYLDAYRWVVSDDWTWPFSFVNVCELMGMTPARVRQELIGDQSLGLFRYQMSRFGRVVSRVQTSLAQLFATERNAGARYAR